MFRLHPDNESPSVLPNLSRYPSAVCCMRSGTTAASASMVLILVCLPERQGGHLGVTALFRAGLI